MNKRDKITLLETGGLFKFTYCDGVRTHRNLYGRVVKVTTNGTKSQHYLKIENEALMQFIDKDENGNPRMKNRGTYQLSYNGLLNLKGLSDIEKVKD